MTQATAESISPLVSLFRAELLDHTVPIALWLAQQTPSGELREAVCRGVLSIRGAARIVGATEVSEAADAVEATLTRWAALSASEAGQARALIGELVSAFRAHADPDPALEPALMSAKLNQLRLALETLGRAAPRGVRPVRASVPSENRPLEASLVELFGAEVEQCTATLTAGIVDLETESSSPERWERLMRAAHSLKGAARIVSLVSVAQLAHALEECFLSAQVSLLPPSSEQVDAFLQAVDLMQSAAHAMMRGDSLAAAQSETAAEQMATRLRLLGMAEPGALPSSEVPALLERFEVANEGGQVTPAREPSLSLVPAPSAQAALMPASTASSSKRDGRAREEATNPQAERVLRVAADSIDRLMGLAGESLVESRRVASLSKTLLRVRREQAGLLERLSAIDRSQLQTEDGSPHALLAIVARARECLQLLAQHSSDFEGYVRRAEHLGERLYREALKSRMRPFGDGTHGLPRLVRDVSRQLGKRTRIRMLGESTEVDRDVLDSLEAPISHLLRNALDHGIEPPEERAQREKPEIAELKVEARHHAGMLSVVVSDDGRGIDIENLRARVVHKNLATAHSAATLSRTELLDFLFLPGFSTAQTVSDISGRGVGLDVVRTSVEALGGSVRIHTELGRGTSFQLLLPVTRSVVRALVAEVDGDPFAFPLLRIDRIECVPFAAVNTLEGQRYVLLNQQTVALISARQLLGFAANAPTTNELNVVVVSDRGQRFGIVVDKFRGEHDLVVRPLDTRLGKIEDVAAAATLMDGSTALIVDVDDMIKSIERLIRAGSVSAVETTRAGRDLKKRVLVVDDSITVREAERQVLVNHGYEVDVAVDGMDGLNGARRRAYDLIITDIDMPRMNGIELVKQLKQDAKLNRIPIIIVSYKDREEDRLRGLEAGASYYLTKSSFHDDRLVEIVEDLIGGAGS